MDGGYDFLKYDQVWQRVAPGLEPWSGRNPAADKMDGADNMNGTDRAGGMNRLDKPDRTDRPGGPSGPGRPGGPAWKPCPPFRGTDGPEVLADFIQEELTEQRQFQAMSRTAPAWARPGLRDLAARCAAHARRLSAAYYLTTGERYSPAVSLGQVFPGPWETALRERYQSRVCAGLRYAQAAERTGDPCMERLLEELSGEAYRSAADILRMLERGGRM